MKKGSKNVFVIGEKHTNIWGQTFEIIGYTEHVRKRIIKFESGCIKTVYILSIKNKKIKDFNQNTIYGVGCLGMEDATCHYLWWRWFNMIGRCYDLNHCQYKSYGDKGIYVEEYLRNFKNYVQFIESLPNASKLKEFPDEWQIDKDLKSKSNLCYSRDTITIMKGVDNLELENKGKRIQVFMFSLDDKLINKFKSISEAERKTGVYRGNIARVIRGDSKTAGGYKWKTSINKEVNYV